MATTQLKDKMMVDSDTIATVNVNICIVFLLREKGGPRMVVEELMVELATKPVDGYEKLHQRQYLGIPEYGLLL